MKRTAKNVLSALNIDYKKIIREIKKDKLGEKIDTHIEYNILGSGNGVWPAPRQLLQSSRQPVVLSFGVGYDLEFEKDVNKLYNAKIFAFDPTPKSIEWVNSNYLPSNIQFRPKGISKNNEIIDFYPIDENSKDRPGFSSKRGGGNCHKGECKCLHDILQEEGLNISDVDILKMDIEGMEYEVVGDLIENKYFPDYLLIEYHHRRYNIKPRQTKKSIQKLRENGYKVFYISDTGYEFGLVYCGVRD